MLFAKVFWIRANMETFSLVFPFLAKPRWFGDSDDHCHADCCEKGYTDYDFNHNISLKMALPTGFEPVYVGLEDRCVILYATGAKLVKT